MKDLKYLVPNLFTSLSLLSALFAIYYISLGEFILAPWLILLSIICDFLDGKFARILHASTEFGALFDTMADFVAFGLAPAFLIYQVSLHQFPFLGPLVTIIYIFSGCYRLIRFSLRKYDDPERSSFIGLPIPMAAGFIAAIVLLSFQTLNQIPDSLYFLILTFLISLLMSSRIEYWKLEYNGKPSKEIKFLFIIFLLSLISSFRYFHLLILFWTTAYIIFCPIRYIIISLKHKTLEEKI